MDRNLTVHSNNCCFFISKLREHILTTGFMSTGNKFITCEGNFYCKTISQLQHLIIDIPEFFYMCLKSFFIQTYIICLIYPR